MGGRPHAAMRLLGLKKVPVPNFAFRLHGDCARIR